MRRAKRQHQSILPAQVFQTEEMSKSGGDDHAPPKKRTVLSMLSSARETLILDPNDEPFASLVAGWDPILEPNKGIAKELEQNRQARDRLEAEMRADFTNREKSHRWVQFSVEYETACQAYESTVANYRQWEKLRAKED